MKVIISLFTITAMLLLASLFGTVNAGEVHKNGFGGITPLNTTGLAVFNESLKRSFEYESDSLVLSAEFSILESNGDIRDFSLFDNDLTTQNSTGFTTPIFVDSMFRTGLETIPVQSRFISNESMAVPIYWVAQIYPSAIYYNNRTYFTWQGEDLDPFIIYYNHTTDIWADPVEVGNNPWEPADEDYHGAPALLITDDGFIHVFFGSHGFAPGANQKHAKSDSPEDISSWTLQADAASSATYPHLMKNTTGAVFLAYRRTISVNHQPLSLRISTDNASTWGSVNDIMDFGTGWLIYPSLNWEFYGTDQLHFAVRQYEVATTDFSKTFHAILNTSDNKFYSITGVDLGSSIDQTEADNNLVIMETEWVGTGTLHLDSSGTPYVIQIQQDVATEGYNHTFIWWNGTAWENQTIVSTGDGWDGGADFIVYSSTNIEAYLITEGNPDVGGDMERWSWNGSSWTQEQVLLTETDSGIALANPQVPIDNSPELTVFFTQVDRLDWTNNDLEIYAHDGTDFVYGEYLVGGQWANASHSESLDMENTNVSLVWWGQIRDSPSWRYITGKACSDTIPYVYGLVLSAGLRIEAAIATSACSSDTISTSLPSSGLSLGQTYSIGIVFEDNAWGTDVHFWLDGEWIYNETSTERVGDNSADYYVGRSGYSNPINFCNCIHDEVLVFKERLSNDTMKLLTTPEHDIVIRSGPGTTTQGFGSLFFALPWLIVFGLLGWLFYVIFLAWREPFMRD